MKGMLNLLLGGVIIFAIGCASAPEVEQDIGDANAALISAQNGQLSNVPIGGFAYKSSKLPSREWDEWAKSAAPIVKAIIEKIPEGYTLQVTGHTDASGPEEPVGKKPGNLKISTDRAYTIFRALRNAGIRSSKITYKGIGSDELLAEYEPRAAEQRRVTFKLIPTE